MTAAGPVGVASAGYRWYLGAQVLSLAGTMMSYTALFWLVLHIAGGGAPALAAVDAAQTRAWPGSSGRPPSSPAARS